jgi:citrate lyase subunit beta/citryl-CoA lyase
MSSVDFIRRSQLITPAKNAGMIAKAAAGDCDSLIVDLEDAIAPAMKAQARQVLREGLADLQTTGKEIGVRVNGLESPWFLDDMLALVGLPIDTIVVPKMHRPEDLYAVDQLVRQLEHRGLRPGVTLQALIESALGVEHVFAIAKASPRCRALIFGSGDYRADTGATFSHAGFFYARSRVVVAACAARMQALDHVHPNIADLEGLRQAACDGKALGFSGKWAIHPQQVPVINQAYLPSAEEIDRAQRVVAAYEASLQTGVGAIAVDGLLVDEAVLKAAGRHLALASRAGTIPTGGKR